MPLSTPKPRPAATPYGTVTVLPQTGNLAADINAAIRAADTEDLADFTDDEIARLLKEKQIGAGLRAEAGYSAGPLGATFYSSTERLATGKRLGCFLTLSQTPHGDAVYWNIGLGDEVICSADYAGARRILTMMRTAAGGPSTDVSASKTVPPSDDDLATLIRTN